ncbi:MAG: GNAT family N-acetyltransferase [Lachnospiraceae bacterium]|nr:GNAT family N-acetyltransferase [Lachnospiraceae bacterium]
MSVKLITDRLIITTADESYAQGLAEYYSKNREWFEEFEFTHQEAYYTPEYQLRSLQYEMAETEKKQNIYYYVFPKEDPKTVIGTLSYSRLRPLPYLSTVFGYDLGHDYWGKGLMKEACLATMEEIFGTYGMHRIEARVSPANIRSIYLLERMGFVLEGVEYKSVQVRGEFRDHLRYAKISDRK